MSRAYTAEEVREQFLDQVRHLTEYWATVKSDLSTMERCEGLALSILKIFDGITSLPSFDITLAPHPDDKAFRQSEGENWYEDGMVINDCYLHKLL